jgi:hypothetical protein
MMRSRRMSRALLLAAGAAAAVAAGAATAMAEPGQPGLQDSTTVQPGLQGDAQAQSPAATDEREYWVAPPAEYEQVEWQTYDEYVAEPTYYEEPAYIDESAPLHVPEPAVGVVAPIEAPQGRLRLGDFITDKPEWMTDEDLEKTNNSSAIIESQVATFWASTGMPLDRSQKVAAATVGGAAVGAAAVGVPAAVIGGAAGAAIGAPIGASGGAVLVPGVGAVPGATVGGAAGAAVGAAVVGVPAAIVGGVVGGAAGTAFGAGDHLPDEQATELPDSAAETVDGALWLQEQSEKLREDFDAAAAEMLTPLQAPAAPVSPVASEAPVPTEPVAGAAPAAGTQAAAQA